ncbi:hypothetical protein DFA_03897 [Cavenderia fasciculata]|uniref:BP74 N-terminal domain-containing protein n=1 Tax=Cavenderia fasciculata TaxID=261658 RepID=F4Q0Q2_CACFS|nr:uncharacterized protein DFA_03897 [Cavenderia fasciculata]EGG18403.1 hypothetical protein DFA_03897 [Cavenderia fasciculata]|eukprot:XP_004366307.1 hypothetical protein DFA_03897 [Cavenderia fasciculata]
MVPLKNKTKRYDLFGRIKTNICIDRLSISVFFSIMYLNLQSGRTDNVLSTCVIYIYMFIAYFSFTTNPSEPEFVFQLNNNNQINKVRSILKGEGGPNVHVKGRFKAGRKDYNPNYSFYFLLKEIEQQPKRRRISK